MSTVGILIRTEAHCYPYLQLTFSGIREIMGSREGDNGKDGTDDGVGSDDDQSLKTPSLLPPALSSLPPADNQWYKR